MNIQIKFVFFKIVRNIIISYTSAITKAYITTVLHRNIKLRSLSTAGKYTKHIKI